MIRDLVLYTELADIANVRGYQSISARWRLSVVPLRSVVIGTAKRAPEKATAPLGLGIVIVVGLVPAGNHQAREISYGGCNAGKW